MGESIFSWIWWLANVPLAGRWFLLVIFGLRAASRWLLGKYYGITITDSIEVYPERRVLDRHSDLEGLLQNSESVEACSVIGFTLINRLSHPERFLKKLLLPNPDSNSLKNLETTTERKGHFTETIKTVTRSALERRINVKWYCEFVGYSFLIVDRNKDTGWIHVEFVLPHTTEHLSRPSIRVKKSKQPKVFQHFVQAFDNMWDAAQAPTGI